jgi:hypothetical protein
MDLGPRGETVAANCVDDPGRLGEAVA